MDVIWAILGGTALVCIGVALALGFVVWVMMHADAGQLALAAQVLRDKVATLQTTLEIEVAELREKVATLWGRRDG